MTDPPDLRSVGDISRETQDCLQLFVSELERWQGVKNLVGPGELRQIWTRHIADSLQLTDLAPQAAKWLDIGSGAGFPGLVIAISGRERSGFQVDLVEGNGRKCAFLRAAARITGAPARVHHARIEAVATSFVGKVDIVTARALAPLEQLLVWSHELLLAGAVGLFPKGKEAMTELTDARKSWTFTADLVPSRTDANASIVRITDFEGRAA